MQHYVIVADLGNFRTDSAYVDVAADQNQVPAVQFEIFFAERVVDIVDVTNGIASSRDIIAYAKQNNLPLPVLVLAETVNALNPPNVILLASSAILRQSKLSMSAPDARGLGTGFQIPIGDVGTSSAQLLIGNPGALNGAPIDVTVMPTFGGIQTLTVGANQVGVVDISQAMQMVNLGSNSPYAVQLAIPGRGQTYTMTAMLPAV